MEMDEKGKVVGFGLPERGNMSRQHGPHLLISLGEPTR